MMMVVVMVMLVVVMVMMVIVMRERKGASDPELVVGSLFPPQPLCHSFVVVAVFNSDCIVHWRLFGITIRSSSSCFVYTFIVQCETYGHRNALVGHLFYSKGNRAGLY